MRNPFSIALTTACLAASSWTTPAAAVIVADSADDVCAPGPTLCLVTDTVTVQSGSTLDFGTQPLQVSGGGQFDVGSGSAIILAGPITFSSGSTARLRVRNGGVGGSATVVARRACSGDTARACISNGQCSVAGAGTCSVGAGTLTVDGSIVGAAEPPPIIVLRAAGDVTINLGINANGSSVLSDGGEIDVESVQGSVVVNAKLQASSGSQGTGGAVDLSAGGDVIVNAELNAQGGDGDGGCIDIFADGNVEIHNDVFVDATGGEGWGGEIFVEAGRDLNITGGSSSDRLTLGSKGNTLVIDNSGGDGGEQDYIAFGSIVVGEFAQFTASGAAPDGSGELISLDAGVDLILAGDIESKARGFDGGGGVVELLAGRDISVAATALIDVTGGSFGAGDVEIAAFDDYFQAGTIDLSAGSGGDAGSAVIDIEGDLTLSGTITSNAPARFGVDTVELIGCQLRLTPTAVINTRGDFSVNTLTGHESVTVEAGAQITAGGIAGANNVVYRNVSQPPVLDGTISPAPNVVENPDLSPCPVCGDGQRTLTETCDDGNTVAGDGCDADCVDEACIAATPDYPINSLCDDAVPCTVDSCANSQCSHVPDDAVCTDENVCTDETCSPQTGCVIVPNSAPCDDAVACTIGDTCAGGVCHGVPMCPQGETCDLDSGMCEVVVTTTTSTSSTLLTPTTTTTLGTVTTTTTLPGGPVCGDGTVEGGESCDHGALNGVTGDSCGAQCQLRDCGDPNGSGSTTASDALFVLQAAVGSAICDVCLCDVVAGAGSPITASDALAVLRRSVGIQVPFTCPPCS